SGSLRCPASLAAFLRFDRGEFLQTIHPEHPHTRCAKNPERLAFGSSEDRVWNFSIVVHQDEDSGRLFGSSKCRPREANNKTQCCNNKAQTSSNTIVLVRPEC